MRILHGSSFLPATARRTVVGVGNFDGVHLGHRALLQHLVEQSRRLALPALVLTFRPHPARILRPASAPPLLCEPEEERIRLAETGIDFLLEEEFSPDFAQLSPADFVHRILHDRLGAALVVVGYNFRFGSDAAGSTEDLVRLARAANIDCQIVAPISLDGAPVHSTRIRQAIRQGHLELAARLLGRPYRLSGQVVQGAGRGRQLGFPTINLTIPDVVLPADGVYAARALLHALDDLPVAAAVCIGLQPTFLGSQRTIEAHLLDFADDLYGTRVSLEFISWLRPEQRFPTRDDLVNTLKEDVRMTRQRVRADGSGSGHPSAPERPTA